MIRSAILFIATLVLISCANDLGELCEDNEDCQKGLICVSRLALGADKPGQCVMDCFEDSDCPDGTACFGGTACLPTCDGSDTSRCPEGTACSFSFGFCVTACSNNADCSSNSCSESKVCDGPI